MHSDRRWQLQDGAAVCTIPAVDAAHYSRAVMLRRVAARALPASARRVHLSASFERESQRKFRKNYQPEWKPKKVELGQKVRHWANSEGVPRRRPPVVGLLVTVSRRPSPFRGPCPHLLSRPMP